MYKPEINQEWHLHSQRLNTLSTLVRTSFASLAGGVWVIIILACLQGVWVWMYALLMTYVWLGAGGLIYVVCTVLLFQMPFYWLDITGSYILRSPVSVSANCLLLANQLLYKRHSKRNGIWPLSGSICF